LESGVAPFMSILASLGLYSLMVFAAIAGILALLVWSLRREANAKRAGKEGLESFNFSATHVTYMAQMQQALHREDYSFLASRGSAGLARKVKQERARILLGYLDAMRDEFERLIRVAAVIAALSPEVAPAQEWERFRLTVRFALSYRLVRARLRLGLMAAPQLNELSRGVCQLTMRIEKAMTELGERATLAGEIASTSHS
jgi:hypothetical protein